MTAEATGGGAAAPDLGKLADNLASAIRLRHAMDESARDGHAVPAQIAASAEREVRDAETALVRALLALPPPAPSDLSDAQLLAVAAPGRAAVTDDELRTIAAGRARVKGASMTKLRGIITAALIALPALPAPAWAQIKLSTEPVGTPSLSDVFLFTQGYTGPLTGQTKNATLQSILNTPGSTQYAPKVNATLTAPTINGGTLTGATINGETQVNGPSVVGPYYNGVVNSNPLLNITQVDTMTNGTAGYVVPTLRVQTNIGGTPGNYAWGISSIVNMTASTGQHVGIASACWKQAGGTAPCWAFLGQIADQMGGASSADGSIVSGELDMAANAADDGGSATGNIPSGQGIRVGLDLIGSPYGTGSNPTFGWGYRVSGQSNVTFQRAFAVNSPVSIAAFDTEYATLGTGANALRMAAGQNISFNAGDHVLSYGSGTLSYTPTTTAVFSVSDAGGVTAATLTATALPTSCSGKPTGTLWNSTGVVNVCP